MRAKYYRDINRKLLLEIERVRAEAGLTITRHLIEEGKLRQENKRLRDKRVADAELIVHAHWENVGGNDKVGYASGTCSHCRQEAWANYELTPRCPYCGAHMDEEVK